MNIVNTAMPQPTIGILTLQGDVREHMQALQALGVKTLPVRTDRDLNQVDGIVIPGGESTTISKLLGIFELYEPLKSALVTGLPAYGSCAGMIVLASEILNTRPDATCLDALDITVRRNAFGRQVDSFELYAKMTGIDGGPFPMVFIRAPWVERVGSDVEVLATVPSESAYLFELQHQHSSEGVSEPQFDPIVAVRQGNVLATSFHPEVVADYRVHELFLNMVKQS